MPWTTRIKPHQGALDWRLPELWRYRDLISLFVRRDFVALYKQTILGPAWHVIQPLLTTLTYTLIFGKLAGLSTDGRPQFLFYMCGTVLWTYFATTLTKTSNTFVGNAALMGKVYFHRLAVPVSIVLSNLIAFAIQFTILVIVWTSMWAAGQKVEPNAWLLTLPLLLLMMAGFALGGGIIVSALTTRYRDLVQLITFGVQLLMFATPVIYPVSSIPARFQWIAAINPLAPIIETFRHALLGGGSASWQALAISFAVMLVVLATGLMLFSRVERTFMDTV